MNVSLSPSTPLATPDARAFGLRQTLWATFGGIVLALAFSAYYLNHTFVMNEADPRLLAQFEGNRPYQLRILMPFLAHWGARLTPFDVVRCYQILLMGFSVALFAVFAAYLRQWSASRAAAWLSLSIALPLFAFYSHKWFYPYDVPAVFFATLGLLLMAQRRFALYLAVFTLATLNRETSAFLTLAFVLTLWDVLPRRRFALLVASQMGIWLAVRGIMSWIFASNAGKPLELHLATNWNALTQLFTAPPTLALGSAIIALAGMWAIGAATRRYQPPFLRRASGVFWPFMASMSVVGVLSETRLYSELIPILLAPALVGVLNLTRTRTS